LPCDFFLEFLAPCRGITLCDKFRQVREADRFSMGAANAVCVMKPKSGIRQVPTGPAAGRGVCANYKVVADRVAGHLFYQADSASFFDARVCAPVLQ
jgi:hypothetical protein